MSQLQILTNQVSFSKEALDMLLVQVNSSVFPLGSYAQSYGLENYINENTVTDLETSYRYIEAYLTNKLLYSEALAVKIAYELAINNDIHGLLELDQEIFASTVPRESKNASKLLGESFMVAIDNLNVKHDLPIYQKYVAYLKKYQLATNHAVIYGVFCAALSIEMATTITHYLYGVVEALIQILVKTIPLGQKPGQYITARMIEPIQEIVNKCFTLDRGYLSISTPHFDAASMRHEVGFSRMYMS